MLTSITSPLEEEYIILYILNVLPVQYNSFKKIIRARSHPISIIDLQELFLIEDQQLETNSSTLSQDHSFLYSSFIASQKIEEKHSDTETSTNNARQSKGGHGRGSGRATSIAPSCFARFGKVKDTQHTSVITGWIQCFKNHSPIMHHVLVFLNRFQQVINLSQH